MKTLKTTRSVYVTIEFQSDDFQQICTAAEQQGMRMTEFIKRAAIDKSVSLITEVG